LINGKLSIDDGIFNPEFFIQKIGRGFRDVGFYIGNYPTSVNELKKIKAAGATAVLNLQTFKEKMKHDKLSNQDYIKQGLAYKCIEISELDPDIEGKMMKGIEILESLIIKQKKRVFIHDAENGTRSSTLMVIFLCIKNSMGLNTPESA
jgi:hypothetical protein